MSTSEDRCPQDDQSDHCLVFPVTNHGHDGATTTQTYFVFQLCLQEENHVSCYHVCVRMRVTVPRYVCVCVCVCVIVPWCVCVCNIVLIAVCGTSVILIILPCDKQKQVCDHKFITIL